MSEDADILPAGTVIAGRYRVGRRLGEGGMGSVYLVQHLKTDEELALKLLHSTVVRDAAALERFQREARTPARIGSDHVTRVIDADVAPELGGVPFLVMELLRGNDLDQLLERRGSLPPSEVVTYLRQAARALDKAHALGVVHRDLKPENLFLTAREDGTPFIKVLDFGIAKLTGAAAGDLARHGSVTTTGQIFGTPLYMSPEQAKAESAKISPQTDVWALGLIAHKLLTGRDVWTAETLTHLIAQIAYEPMPVPSTRGAHFGPSYDAWFARCCAREPEARYRSAGEAVAALGVALGLRDTLGPLSSEVPGAIVSLPYPPSVVPPGEEASRASLAETAEIVTTRDAVGSGSGRLGGSGAGDVPPMRRGLVLAIATVGVLAGVGVGLALVKDRGPSPAAVASSQPATTAAPSATARVEPASAATASAASPVVAPAPEPSASASAEPSARAPVPSAPRPPVGGKPTAAPTPAAAPASAAPKPPTPAPAATDDPLAGRH